MLKLVFTFTIRPTSAIIIHAVPGFKKRSERFLVGTSPGTYTSVNPQCVFLFLKSFAPPEILLKLVFSKVIFFRGHCL